YDEPQAGRYRYFHQWDVEVYGPFSIESDAEVIEFIASFFKKLGLAVSIEVNDRQLVEQYIRERLGVTDDAKVVEMFRAVDKVPKKGAAAVLHEYKDTVEQGKLQALIDLSQVRGSAREIAARADVQELAGWQKIASLMESLAARKVDNVSVNLGIVRGLDYYSGVVFEVFSGEGGALVGGGRYDRLTDAFGRKDIGATGAAGGVERIILALQKQGLLRPAQKPLVYVAYASDEARTKALELVALLREGGIAADYDILGRALRKQMDDASTKGALAALIVAPSEIAEGKVTVKSMKDGTESRQPLEAVIDAVGSLLRA
ncbi:MAG: ATP phosphoribosyltransferase regulatory subunit, partial [Nitrososphaera sp.]